MSIRDLAWDVGALTAALAIGFGVGYVRGDAAGMTAMNAKVLTAQAAQSAAEKQAGAAKEGLGQVQAKLAAQKLDLQAASARATRAIADRDALAQKLADASRQ